MKLTDEQIASLGEEVIKVLKTIYDPEIPVDIYELGLIYDVQISDEGEAKVLSDPYYAELSRGRESSDGGGRESR